MDKKFNPRVWREDLEKYYGSVDDDSISQGSPADSAYINYDEFRSDNMAELLESAGYSLPFGEEMPFAEYLKLMEDLSIKFSFNVENCMKNTLIPEEEQERALNASEELPQLVQFPHQDELKDLINQILDGYGVPSGQADLLK